MRQLGDLLVWVLLVGVVAGVIYFAPVIIQQVSGIESVTISKHAHTSDGN
jgi:hypothetical protein